MYTKDGDEQKRFACALFILCCFLPETALHFRFYMDRGFVSEEQPILLTVQEADITLSQGMETKGEVFLHEELAQEAEGFDNTDYHNLDQADKYSADDILNENQDLPMKAEEQKKDTEELWNRGCALKNSVINTCKFTYVRNTAKMTEIIEDI